MLYAKQVDTTAQNVTIKPLRREKLCFFRVFSISPMLRKYKTSNKYEAL